MSPGSTSFTPILETHVNRYDNIHEANHVARFVPPVSKDTACARCVIENTSGDPVADVLIRVTTAARRGGPQMTDLDALLLLGENEFALTTIHRRGGPRTALRWLMRQLNNGSIYTETRLKLESRARKAGFTESQLLSCWHADERRYCARLLVLLEKE